MPVKTVFLQVPSAKRHNHGRVFMNLTEAVEEYKKAQKAGQKELRDLTARGLNAYPAVLDELLPDISQHSVQELPVQEIPIERIIGVKSAGRVTAFTAGFLPLLDPDTEFGTKWIALCGAHLSEVGIRDPITVYEYLCDFYVLEGNKRVSVLKHFGAATIPAVIKRVIPTESDDPAVKAYGEFLDFYKHTKLYSIKLTKPGTGLLKKAAPFPPCTTVSARRSHLSEVSTRG